MTNAPSTPQPAADATGSAHIKATREDWLRVAMDVLVSDGMSEVKVLTISQRLDVSRSSFYWYFKSRKDLMNQLLAEWKKPIPASWWPRPKPPPPPLPPR